jgi:hypothetical protein
MKDCNILYPFRQNSLEKRFKECNELLADEKERSGGSTPEDEGQ